MEITISVGIFSTRVHSLSEIYHAATLDRTIRGLNAGRGRNLCTHGRKENFIRKRSMRMSNYRPAIIHATMIFVIKDIAAVHQGELLVVIEVRIFSVVVSNRCIIE